jgi:hypothetical protein
LLYDYQSISRENTDVAVSSSKSTPAKNISAVDVKNIAKQQIHYHSSRENHEKSIFFTAALILLRKRQLLCQHKSMCSISVERFPLSYHLVGCGFHSE